MFGVVQQILYVDDVLALQDQVQQPAGRGRERARPWCAAALRRRRLPLQISLGNELISRSPSRSRWWWACLLPALIGRETASDLCHFGADRMPGAKPADVAAGQRENRWIATAESVLLPQPRFQLRLDDRELRRGEPIEGREKPFSGGRKVLHPRDGTESRSKTRRTRATRPFDPLSKNAESRANARCG